MPSPCDPVNLADEYLIATEATETKLLPVLFFYLLLVYTSTCRAGTSRKVAIGSTEATSSSIVLVHLSKSPLT